MIDDATPDERLIRRLRSDLHEALSLLVVARPHDRVERAEPSSAEETPRAEWLRRRAELLQRCGRPRF